MAENVVVKIFNNVIYVHFNLLFRSNLSPYPSCRDYIHIRKMFLRPSFRKAGSSSSTHANRHDYSGCKSNPCNNLNRCLYSEIVRYDPCCQCPDCVA